MEYGWTWIDGEDEESGNWWIQIGPLEPADEHGGPYQSEEMATIMCRNYEAVKRDHPEWIEAKEQNAELIVAALNNKWVAVSYTDDGPCVEGPFATEQGALNTILDFYINEGLVENRGEAQERYDNTGDEWVTKLR